MLCVFDFFFPERRQSALFQIFFLLKFTFHLTEAEETVDCIGQPHRDLWMHLQNYNYFLNQIYIDFTSPPPAPPQFSNYLDHHG